MNYEMPAPHVGTAVLPRMGAALPQLPQLSASSWPRLGGVSPDQIRGGRAETAVSELPPVRKKDAAALLVK